MTLVADWLASQISADFTAHNVLINGVAPEVLYGSEKAYSGKPGPWVVVGLAPTFSIREPAGMAPGLRDVDGVPNMKARAVYSRVQGCAVTVKAPPPVGTERATDRSKQAAAACAKLLHETLAAVYRCARGSIGIDSTVSHSQCEWVGADTADLHYPAMARFVVDIAVPVLDIMWPLVTVAQGPTADPPEESPVGPSSVIAVDPGDGSETVDALTPGT